MKKTKAAPNPTTIADTYETEIEYTCSVRGRVKQLVKVKRYKSIEPSVVIEEVLPKQSLTEELDRKYSGLLITDDSLDEQFENES